MEIFCGNDLTHLSQNLVFHPRRAVPQQKSYVSCLLFLNSCSILCSESGNTTDCATFCPLSLLVSYRVHLFIFLTRLLQTENSLHHSNYLPLSPFQTSLFHINSQHMPICTLAHLRSRHDTLTDTPANTADPFFHSPKSCSTFLFWKLSYESSYTIRIVTGMKTFHLFIWSDFVTQGIIKQLKRVGNTGIWRLFCIVPSHSGAGSAFTGGELQSHAQKRWNFTVKLT